jgi:hypothetical protein
MGNIIVLVFSVGIRSVFLGIYHTDTEGKLSQIFRIRNLAVAPQKIGGSPLFHKKGGGGPLFVHFALLLKKKRNFRNFSKKEFPRKLKNVFPPKFTVQQYRQKYRKSSKSDTGKIPIPKKLLVTP